MAGEIGTNAVPLNAGMAGAGELQDVVGGLLGAVDGFHDDAAGAAGGFKREVSDVQHALSERLIDAHVLHLGELDGPRGFRKQPGLVAQAVVQDDELGQSAAQVADGREQNGGGRRQEINQFDQLNRGPQLHASIITCELPVGAFRRAEVRRAHPARVKVDRARKAVKVLAAKTACHGEIPEDPIVASGVIVHGGALEIDTRGSQAPAGFVSDRILADSNGLVGGETAILIETAVMVEIARGRAVKATILLTRRRPIAAAIRLRRRRPAPVLTGIIAAAPTPEDVESVALGAVVAVFDSDDRGSAAAGIANQLLAAPSIDTGKTKFAWIGGHRRGAYKAPPLWRLSG